MLKPYFEKALSYSAYVDHFEEVLDNPPEGYPNHKYVKLNWSRHKRLTKKSVLIKPFENFSSLNLSALVITEAWCGDSAQNLPTIHKICEAANIELKVVLRDQSDLIEQYLTNGGQSIPIAIFFNEHESLHATWGPRPAPVQKMVMDNKASGALSYDDLSIETQKWYNQDESKTLQNEIFDLLSQL